MSTFKLPDTIPQIRTPLGDWADYAEYNAVTQTGNIALYDLVKPGKLVSDEIQVSGILDESDQFNVKIESILSEMRTRMMLLGNKYPFELTNHDYTVRFNTSDETSNLVYRYLLLATRLNMRDEKILEGIDGTQTFEKLCGAVAQNYFGHLANVDVFGTSKTVEGGFRAKLTDVVRRLGEGGELHPNIHYRPQDDKIDIIIWKGFGDKKPSQLIGYGQCKTGTSWETTLNQLNILNFNKRWFTRHPIVDPIKMFFCAQYFPNNLWYERGVDAGLVFDRFRILEYLPDTLDIHLKQELEVWTAAAEARFT